MTPPPFLTIEDDAWLGGHVVVLPGVMIGTRSVIGAGSVVTKSIRQMCSLPAIRAG